MESGDSAFAVIISFILLFFEADQKLKTAIINPKIAVIIIFTVGGNPKNIINIRRIPKNPAKKFCHILNLL